MEKTYWLTLLGIAVILSIWNANAVDCASLATCKVNGDCTINSVCSWDQSQYRFRSISINAPTYGPPYTSRKITVSGDFAINAGGSINCPSCAIEIIAAGTAQCNQNINLDGYAGGDGGDGSNAYNCGKHKHFCIPDAHDNQCDGANAGSGSAGANAGTLRITANIINLGGCGIRARGGDGGDGGDGGWSNCDGWSCGWHCASGGHAAVGGNSGSGGNLIFNYVQSIQSPGSYLISAGSRGSGGWEILDYCVAGICSTGFPPAYPVSDGSRGADGTKTETRIDRQTLAADFLTSCQSTIGQSGTAMFNSDLNLPKACCGDEAVLNPGLEKTTSPLGWTSDFFTAAGIGTTERAHSGSRSLRAPPGSTAGSRYSFSDSVVVVSGQQYKLSGWIFKEVLTDIAYIEVVLPSGASLSPQCKGSAFSSGVWEHVECSFTASSSAIRIQATVGPTTQGKVFFDDIHLIGPNLDLGTTETDINDVNYICNNNGETWQWQAANQIVYKITPVDSVKDSISNSKNWYACDPPNDFRLVNPFLNLETLQSQRDECSLPGGCIRLTDGNLLTSPSLGPQPTASSDQVISMDNFLANINIAQQQEPPVTVEAVSPPNTGARITITPTKGFGSLNSEIKIVGLAGFKGAIIKHNSTKLGNKNTTHSSSLGEPISGGAFQEFKISLSAYNPATSQTKLDLNITTYNNDNTINTTYIFEDIYELQPVPNPDIVKSQRFICSQEAKYGALYECAGYNINTKTPGQPQNKVKRVAEVLGTIQDYPGITTNNVRRLLLSVTRPSGFPYRGAAANYSIIQNPYIPLKITDWTTYDNLELDYFTTTKYPTLRIYNQKYSYSIRNNYLAKIVLINETVGDRELNKWHHIIIDLARYGLKRNDIAAVILDINGTQVDLENSTCQSKPTETEKIGCVDKYTLGQSQTKYSAILGFDRMFLSRNQEINKNITCGWKTLWIDDLDEDPIACSNTVTTSYTGSRCCGDDQGRLNITENKKINETFNDQLAGCFIGSTIRNNTLAANKSLIYFSDSETGSKFRSCNLLSNAQGVAKFNGLISQFNPSSPQPENNIKDEALCQNIGSYYCEFNNKWQHALNYNTSQPINQLKNNTNVPDYDFATGSILSACCPETYCWTGLELQKNPDGSNRQYTGCEAPYRDPKKKPIFKENEPNYPKGYRCNEQGNWTLVSAKKDFLLNDTGYCNINTQCYANRNCYDSGQWYSLGTDRLCINGNWTTRTKYVAAALLNYSTNTGIGDYILYCDNVKAALGIEQLNPASLGLDINYNVRDLIDYSTSTKYSNQYLGGLRFPGAEPSSCGDSSCVNNFCVFKYKTTGSNDIKTIVATSLNKPINTTTYPLGELFGFSGNVEEIPEGYNITKIFDSTDSGTLYYVKDMQVIFYTINTNIHPPLEEVTLGERILLALQHPIQTIGSFFKARGPKYDIYARVTDFDRLYIARIGDKNVVGIQETKLNPASNKTNVFLAINYTGFAPNVICSAARNASLRSIDGSIPVIGATKLNCTSSGSSQYVHLAVTPDKNIDSVWPDLTAKTRIS